MAAQALQNSRGLTFMGVLRGLLLLWGALSLAGVVSVIGFVAYHRLGPGNRVKLDTLSAAQAKSVLRRGGLEGDRFQAVLHSRMSRIAPDGDHQDAFAVQIAPGLLEDLSAYNRDHRVEDWIRADGLPEILQDSVKQINEPELGWFPTQEDLRSARLYVRALEIRCLGTRPYSFDLLIFRPADNLVFYYSYKI